LNQQFKTLEKSARTDFRDEKWYGIPTFRRTMDLRYRGQGYELNIPFTKNLLKDFEEEHRRRYGYVYATRDIELVTLRLRAALKSKAAHVGSVVTRAGRSKAANSSPLDAAVLFDGKKCKSKIYSREELRSSGKYHGPAIVTEYSATTVIPPRATFRVDKAANLIIAL
jgi:N-methylhydantoinase A